MAPKGITHVRGAREDNTSRTTRQSYWLHDHSPALYGPGRAASLPVTLIDCAIHSWLSGKYLSNAPVYCHQLNNSARLGMSDARDHAAAAADVMQQLTLGGRKARMRCFSEAAPDATVHCQIIDLGQQIFVWMAVGGAKLQNMYLAIQNRLVCTPRPTRCRTSIHLVAP